MLVAAIIIFVIVGLLIVASIIRRKKILGFKSLLILTIIGVGLFVFGTRFQNDDQELAYYQQIAPNTVDAPYMLITDTRTYYVAEWYENAEFFTLQRFWYFDKDEWEQSSMPLKFDKSIGVYADLEIVKRGG